MKDVTVEDFTAAVRTLGNATIASVKQEQFGRGGRDKMDEEKRKARALFKLVFGRWPTEQEYAAMIPG